MPASKQNKKAVANSAGTPATYMCEYALQAHKLCLLGATDAQLADFFEVDIDTLDNWKATHLEFADTLQKGKYYADSVVAASLYDKAKGYKIKKQVPVKLVTKTPVLDKDGEPTRFVEQTERVEVVEVEEDVPADKSAAVFWLENRQPREWRDKSPADAPGAASASHTVKIEIINSGPAPVNSEKDIALTQHV
ncbi:hypothetical protein DJ568_15455 [Mucilaginibacter hurinus]|uniref:Terminase n=1 Tax=Mucilaginibacter hurinus TaxID=2201324 RepID=A0A367GKC7_9SPHI|nr:hypothetical protein [Mucilaginibacter hurinus]RCH53934.1 hypothetical protein DJ568_15455 [Mucilaginibacter hurinus]